MTKVLVAEHDPMLSELMMRNLMLQGHQVLGTRNATEVLRLTRQDKPDVVLLDPKLPGLDTANCHALRRESDARILLLVTHETSREFMQTLGDCTDDFIMKPFSMTELHARMDVALRRVRQQPKTTFGSGDLLLDLASHRAWRNGQLLGLPPKEYFLLAELLRNKGVVLSRRHLLDRVWGADFQGDSRTLDVHVRALRSKIEPNLGRPTRIETVRGIGYRFCR